MSENERTEYFNNYKSKGPIVWLCIFGGFALLTLIGFFESWHWLWIVFFAAILLLMLIPISVKRKREKRIKKRLFDKAIIHSLNRCKDKDYLVALVLIKCDLHPLSDLEIANNPSFCWVNDIIKEIPVDDIRRELHKEE